jgi:hypothetical protein
MSYLVGAGNIHSRLGKAWLHINDFHFARNPRDTDFTLPSWLAEEFTELAASWERAGNFENRIGEMSTVDCVEEAQRIVSWYARFIRESGAMEPASNVHQNTSQLRRAPAIVPPGSPTRDMLSGRES